MARQCKDGFVSTYLKYTSKQASPTIFHVWSAISIISAVLTRKVWMESSGSLTEAGYYKLYPNLYIVLVSPSGVGMKGTAMKLAVNGILDNTNIDITTVRGKITSTRLVSKMKARMDKATSGGIGHAFIHSEEFKVFTRGIMKDSSLLEDLTQIYDCGPFDYETEHGQQVRLDKPCLTIIGGSTPEWLSGGTAGDLLSGGLGARLVPVCVLRNEREFAWATKTEVEKAHQETLINDLQEISTLEGGFFVTQEAKDFFEKWYLGREQLRMKDERLAGYFSKKHDLVRKLSMIWAVSGSDELVIQKKHIELSLSLLDAVEQTITHAYTGSVFGLDAVQQEKVFSFIMKAGDEGIGHAVLLRAVGFHMGARRMRESIETLLAAERIESFEVQTVTKPKVMYRVKKERKEDR